MSIRPPVASSSQIFTLFSSSRERLGSVPQLWWPRHVKLCSVKSWKSLFIMAMTWREIGTISSESMAHTHTSHQAPRPKPCLGRWCGIESQPQPRLVDDLPNIHSLIWKKCLTSHGDWFCQALWLSSAAQTARVWGTRCHSPFAEVWLFGLGQLQQNILLGNAGTPIQNEDNREEFLNNSKPNEEENFIVCFVSTAPRTFTISSCCPGASMAWGQRLSPATKREFSGTEECDELKEGVCWDEVVPSRTSNFVFLRSISI